MTAREVADPGSNNVRDSTFWAYAGALAVWFALVYAGPEGSRSQLALALAVALPFSILLVNAGRMSTTLVPGAWREVLAPVTWLPVAAFARILPIPFLPLSIGIAISAVIAFRFTAALAPHASRETIERWALLALVSPGFVLFQTTVVHDAFQYHATAVSMLFGGDYDLFRELFLFNSYRSYNPYAEGSIRYLGVPLLEMPALAAAHLVAFAAVRLGSHFPTNGFSQPYTIAISLLSCSAGLFGIALSYRWVRAELGRRFAFAATVLITWASAIPFFVYLWHGWTHAYSIFFSAAFLSLHDRLHQAGAEARRVEWYLLGLLGGALALIWPINGLIFVVPAVGLIFAFARRPRFTIEVAVLMAAGGALTFVPQFAGWYGATGRPFGATYAKVGDFFDWTHPNLIAVLFSSARHGLFTWHPILLPALLGLGFVRDRAIRLGLIAWVLIQIYVMSCWSVWWTGIGFGNRFFLNLMPAATLGLGALLVRIWGARAAAARLSPRQCLLAISGVLFVCINLSLLGAYRVDAVAEGIAGPNYLQRPERTLAWLLHVLTTDAPLTLSTLTSDFWVNSSFFSVWLRLSNPRYALAAACIGILLLIVALLAGRLASRPYGLARWAPRVALGVTAAIPVLCLWLAFRLGPTPPSNEFFRFDTREEILMPFESMTLIPQGYLRPVKTVEVISFLTYGLFSRYGQPVAVLRVFGENGSPVEHTMVAAIDTAEVSLARAPKFARHSEDHTTIVHEWLTRAASDHVYPAHAYLSRFELPEPMRVTRIEIQMIPGAGDLVVRDVFLEER